MIKYIVPLLKAQGFQFARVDQVPTINAEIIAGGGTPAPAITAVNTALATNNFHLEDKPGDGELAAQCATDGIYCGSTVGGDSGTLYRCTNQQLFTVCSCQDSCVVGDDGVDGSCTCTADNEPGLTDNDVDVGDDGGTSAGDDGGSSGDDGGTPGDGGGADDGASSGASCAGLADGSYCGSAAGGDVNTLYQCSGGAIAGQCVCPTTCQSNGGGADACN